MKKLKKNLDFLFWVCYSPEYGHQTTDFYSRFICLLILFEGAGDTAGTMARRLAKEMESLWLFLDQQGVEPTNNHAERALRFGVLWRKRNNGTQSDKGDRWAERNS